jgi:hypothetical protein
MSKPIHELRGMERIIAETKQEILNHLTFQFYDFGHDVMAELRWDEDREPSPAYPHLNKFISVICGCYALRKTGVFKVRHGLHSHLCSFATIRVTPKDTSLRSLYNDEKLSKFRSSPSRRQNVALHHAMILEKIKPVEPFQSIYQRKEVDDPDASDIEEKEKMVEPDSSDDEFYVERDDDEDEDDDIVIPPSPASKSRPSNSPVVAIASTSSSSSGVDCV